jgi:hypothetical protein
MAFLLNFDVLDAFDNVSHIRLLHNIKKRRISIRILKEVENFLKKRRIILIINDYTIKKRNANVNIS